MIRLSFIIVFWVNYIHGLDEGMVSIGTAIESYSPCDNRAISMNREIGGPPNLENYWNGTLSLTKWPNIREVRLTLELDNPAVVTVDENDGRILVSNNKFHITYFSAPPQLQYANFVVQAPARKPFPNLKNAWLNNLNICPNPQKWSPTILGFGGNEKETNDQEVIEKQTCGKRKVIHQGLVTNGFPSREGDWPWHAAIYHSTSRHGTTTQVYKCGGSLISIKYVLTAAHCVTDGGRVIIPDRILIQLGKHNIKISSPNTQEFLANSVKAHESFDTTNFKNDLALIQLTTEVTFTDFVQPICLWNKNEDSLSDVIGRNGTVIGWGLNERDEFAEILTQGTMPIVSLTTCLESNRDFFGLFVSDTTYCAGFRNGTSVCNGDSGGGMVFLNSGTYHLRGIVSLSTVREGTDMCNPKHYVIFTDVAKYIPWIESKMV